VKDDRLYLIHITECIDRVFSYTEEGRDSFFIDSKTQDAVMRNLQILAESTQRLSTALKEAHPEVDWRSISGFRNVAVHEYLSIDVKRIWDIVEQDLSVLEGQIEAILRGSRSAMLFINILFIYHLPGFRSLIKSLLPRFPGPWSGLSMCLLDPRRGLQGRRGPGLAVPLRGLPKDGGAREYRRGDRPELSLRGGRFRHGRGGAESAAGGRIGYRSCGNADGEAATETLCQVMG